MITKLTKEQELLLPTYRDKWLKIGLSTEQFCLKEVKPIMRAVYEKLLDKKPPLVFIIMDSPLTSWYALVLVGNQVRNQVWNQVGNQVWNQVENQVWNQVWNQVENQVGNQVWNQFENQFGN